MGAFHEGHLSLIRAARAESDLVVVSLFVNPAQFGQGEDLSRYPRDEARDLAQAEAEGADYLFAPARDELYPPGFQTWVEVEELSKPLEGAVRPGHFRGVATVCLKLFNIVRPRLAYFCQKDAQQVAVIKRMVRDLDLDLEIRVLPTVREEDVDAGFLRKLRVTVLVARVPLEVLAGCKLRGVDEQAHDDGVVLGPGGAEEREVTLVEGAHRRN
jgi:pantoate--beta-alanine ligase